MQIFGLLGIYFDASIFQEDFTFIQIRSDHTVRTEKRGNFNYFTSVLFTATHFLRQQNGLKLHSFLYKIIFKKKHF